MSLISNRSKKVLEGRFIKQVSGETAKSIDKAVGKEVTSRGFESAKWSDRSFTSSDSGMVYTHLGPHRFVDMKTRSTESGKIRKKNHPVHNRIVFGHYNHMIMELSFGFTEAVKGELKQLED